MRNRERAVTLVQDDIGIGRLLANLHAKFGKDFTNYRVSCLQRRLALRMAVLKVTTLDEYLACLSANPEEIEQLLDTVTIHVTDFFRDADVYEALEMQILPELVEHKTHSPSRTIRIWSAGCSTGEEAYSIAITVLEYLHAHEAPLVLEVYGTDISKEACATAREGVYPERKVNRVPARLRQKYFEPESSGYRVAADTRRRVRFSVHDLFSAVPFSSLDIVLCRNVLIHFDHAVRNGVLARFHESLGDRGLLILGKSEAVTGTALDLFDLVDPRTKMYRKRALRDSSRRE